MSNFPAGIAALPTVVKIVRSWANNFIGAFDGSNPSKIRLSHNDQDGFVIQCHSTLTETAANRALALYAKADTIGVSAAQFDVNYDGDVHCDKLTVDETSTFTGAMTAAAITSSGAISTTSTLNADGATTLGGQTDLCDASTNFHRFTGASTGNRPVHAFTGSDTNVSGEIQAKAAGTIRLTSSTLANGVLVTPAATGSRPSILPVGDTNRDLIIDGAGTGKLVDASANRYMTIGADLPSGTQMIFWQAAAPTGWTRVNTGFNAGAALLITTGSTGSGAGGGTGTFAGSFGAKTSGGGTAHTHSVGSHTHPQNMGASVGTLVGAQQVFTSGSSGSGDELRAASGGAGTSYIVQSGVSASSGTSGSESAHTHSVAGDSPYYENCMCCSKNA